MCNHELSNREYLLYLDILKDQPVLYRQMLPDTEVWNRPAAYFPAYVNNYFRNPAFADYPVVGLSVAQAEAYCKWLTQTYLQYPKRRFKRVEFVLPGTYAWIHAAGPAQFPWSDTALKNREGRWKANFYVYPDCSTDEQLKRRKHDEDRRGKSAFSGTGVVLLAPVISYMPNAYGLYNMAGNVEEYVSVIDTSIPPRMGVARGEPEYSIKTGYTKGGSWNAPAYYLQNTVMQNPDTVWKASAERGFRYIIWVDDVRR